MGLTYIGFTQVNGYELNSHSLEVRRFSFRRDPFTNYQLTGLAYESASRWRTWTVGATNIKTTVLDSSIQIHLRPTHWLPERWDLIEFDSEQGPGDRATILVELLEASNLNYELFWSKWSADNTARASEFWPAVQTLVEFDLYTRLPALFELAVLDNSLAEFKADLATSVQNSLLDLCVQLKESGDDQLLTLAAKAGLSYGENSELQSMLGPQ